MSLSSAFPDIVAFYASTISNFLLSDPVIYFTGGFISLVCIKAIKVLINN